MVIPLMLAKIIEQISSFVKTQSAENWILLIGPVSCVEILVSAPPGRKAIEKTGAGMGRTRPMPAPVFSDISQ
jgi:hypothetical protein